jgi:hypothetical protein
MKKNELNAKDRLEYYLKQLESKSVNEICVFGTKHKSLYKRLHAYRKDSKVAPTLRELIDIGLKLKGY